MIYSDVTYPGGGTYPAINAAAANIDVDPVFVNGASRNLRLQATSPCIDYTPLTVPRSRSIFPT